MHVLIVSPVFPPEPVTSAITNQHVAAGLVDSGHEVTIITAFPNRPGGKLYHGYRRRFRSVEHIDGFKLIHCFSTLSKKATIGSRLLENLSFGISSTLNALAINPDIVYANTWPIISMGLITALCTCRGIPIVLNIQDIYPETAVNLAKLAEQSLITRMLRYVDSRIVCQAAEIITISENFARFYQVDRRVPEHKIHIVYNWMDSEDIKPGVRNGKFRREQKIPDDGFVILYAGNVGAVADVETIIKSIAVLRDTSNNYDKIAVVIAGDGSHRSACENLARQYNLNKIQFFYPLRQPQVSEVQAASDVLVLPTHKAGSLSSVPSKLIAYMLSGRPILAAVEDVSDTAVILCQAQCGIIVKPEDPEAMAGELNKLMEKPGKMVQMGVNSRRYAEHHFTRSVCVPQVIEVLERAYQARRPHSG
jgi:colanic acid biosynthesis glycosyl transferase WcaI